MLREAPQSSPALPTLTPESRHILTRYLALNQDPLALAIELSKDIIETILILADESLAAWITHFQSLMTARRRELALQTLEQLCKTTPDPIEQRRTATRLLSATRRAHHDRAIEVDSPPKRHPSHKNSSRGESTSMPDTPLIKPNPARTAQQTLHTLLEVIKTKSRGELQSHATIDAHCAAKANINGSTIEDNFEDSKLQFENDPNFAPLAIINHNTEFTCEEPTKNTDTEFEQTITFSQPTTHDTNNNTPTTTRLTFTLESFENAWNITKIHAPP